MKNKIKKEKSVVFDEKIDSSINGFSIVLAFIIVGIMLEFDNSFFGVATKSVQITFIIVGILGLTTEIKNLNLSYNIKGLDNLIMGIFLLGITYIMKIYIAPQNWFFIFKYVYEIILFLIMLFSIYGLSRGLIEMIYSLYKNYKENNKKKNLFSSAIVIISQILGLALIVAQIYEIIK